MCTKQCSTCLHWQGNKLGEWGDCYRVIGYIHPPLLTVTRDVEEGKTKLEIPFDSHDVKYWKFAQGFTQLYTEALIKAVDMPQVRVVNSREKDLQFDQFNGERIGDTTIHYIQTQEDYVCDGWEGVK